MAGGRRGLVAPQNTFLENIVRRSNGKVPVLSVYIYLNGDNVSVVWNVSWWCAVGSSSESSTLIGS